MKPGDVVEEQPDAGVSRSTCQGVANISDYLRLTKSGLLSDSVSYAAAWRMKREIYIVCKSWSCGGLDNMLTSFSRNLPIQEH